MKPGLLERMRVSSTARVAQARAAESLEDLQRRARQQPAPPPLRQSSAGFDVIAEVKLFSPSAGQLAAPGLSPVTQAEGYARAGAMAVSVLTEPLEFHGSLEHLRAVAEALRPLHVPAMRKDFLVDPYQVWEARAAGAGGVLAILAMLSDAEVRAMLDAAAEAGLFVLLEAFDEADLMRAQAYLGRPTAAAAQSYPAQSAGAASRVASAASGGWRAVAPILLGLNCRDLRTLAIDPQRFARLAQSFPKGSSPVAESGLATAQDAAWVSGLGYSAALVGAALMTSGDPGQLLGEMLAAGRQQAQKR